MKHMHESDLSFCLIMDSVYQIVKNKHSRQRGYLTHKEVIDYLNSNSKVAIYDHRMNFIHANFELEED